MADILLKIQNHHTESCGAPPFADRDLSGQYVGYFENPFGEQWVLTVDRETGRAVLRGGDLGWDEEIDVTDGETGDILLGEVEMLWLEACLTASITRSSI